MALQNQFTLSLELTNLVPVGFAIAGKTWDAALRFARQLQSSRSDIVIEEDLALKFGRCRIADNLSRSFRTVVEAQNRAEPLQLVEAGLTLFCGTGPTVVRALTEGRDGPYFAMVVQCMSSCLFEVSSYAPLLNTEAAIVNVPLKMLQYLPDSFS